MKINLEILLLPLEILPHMAHYMKLELTTFNMTREHDMNLIQN
jgi:hypothetical protein